MDEIKKAHLAEKGNIFAGCFLSIYKRSSVGDCYIFSDFNTQSKTYFSLSVIFLNKEDRQRNDATFVSSQLVRFLLTSS